MYANSHEKCDSDMVLWIEQGSSGYLTKGASSQVSGPFSPAMRGMHRLLTVVVIGNSTHTENFFWVELTFALSLTGLLSHQGSNISKTQDQSHSDTTPIFTGHGENF